MDIRGRGAVVTGASRGLGFALARELARGGMRVAMVARDERAIEEAAAAIRAEGGDAHAIAGDVGDKAATYAIAGAAQAMVGPVDVLVHNASTLGPVPLPLLLDTACEDFARVLEVNLVGPFRLTKALAGSMALRGGGLVVHVSSDASVTGYARWGAYGASKAALDQLARVWAAELDGRVRFFSVDPGEMDTTMHATAMPDADRANLARPEAVAARIARMIRAVEGIPSGARIEAGSWEVGA